MEYSQTGQFCGREAGHATGQIVWICPNLGQEFEKALAGPLGYLMHESSQDTGVFPAIGICTAVVQIGLQQSIPAGRVARIPDIVDGIIKIGKVLFFISSEVINQSTMC